MQRRLLPLLLTLIFLAASAWLLVKIYETR